jgi:hypothetical protein
VTRTRYLHLTGLNSVALFEDAQALEELVPGILPSWPFTWGKTPGDLPAFATLRPGPKRAWSIALHQNAPTDWNAVDALCDLVAELAWERIRARTGILSLHAAAIAFDGRLVVFPNVKRSGKSTLSIALARLGHRLFADDVLPVDIDGTEGCIAGLGNGAAPRLRLPLPETFSPAFSDWIARDPGPGNRRYKYVNGIDIAPFGAAFPIGAIVVLERQDTPTAPQIDPMERSEVMSRIIHQNFSRDQHAGRILRALDQMTTQLPHYCLRYSSGEEAAHFLHDHTLFKDLPKVAQDAPFAATHWSIKVKGVFDTDATYRRAHGVYETEIGQETFLTDQNGAAIHRMNPGSTMIWRALEAPATCAQITELLSTAFGDVDQDQIERDTARTLRAFAMANLILSG